ncbi:uncharacterized protein NECHADRAFT_77205 [Fusarium vanettenii 77-13-4]|uniref:Uncharacterized protein n=1 Tax=Fusarium vanettenii (strain ATCC MYA-4622 / CBS 123669 / FGSC 9596 / NRRL 45880 / 77-13-4) TaxID=660122 RepID=C7ZJC2_FUSV7|nr:uncharacterized protein NECHADRAFT_77205 [Fusarium vanettenii 77-13-4]EEU35826.1 hypothetical protein NECHADRAFT_77205 [Fusarium vanettenii 77-13-4]
MKLQNLFALFVLAVDASEIFPPCQKHDCVPSGVYTAPGIGFGLSFSSGTAAAHLHNGTVLDLAFVRAKPDYTALMARLIALPEAPPPLNRWRKWRRSINKKLRRPATPDVGTLAEMLTSLRDAATTALAPINPLDRVVVTTPPMPGLADYDLIDALEYASLRPWVCSDFCEELPYADPGFPFGPGVGYPEELTEAHAVMAGHGLGLCEDYDNLDLCFNEEQSMPLEKVMVVGLTETDFRAEVMKTQGSFPEFPDIIYGFVDLTAGLNARGGFQSEEAYWAYIGSRLKMLVSRLPMKLTRVWLAGENSTHPAFLDTIREAIEGSGHGYVFGQGGVDAGQLLERSGAISPTFSSARGAAQYARWRQQAPLGCYERPGCKDERRGDGHDSREKKIDLR